MTGALPAGRAGGRAPPAGGATRVRPLLQRDDARRGAGHRRSRGATWARRPTRGRRARPLRLPRPGRQGRGGAAAALARRARPGASHGCVDATSAARSTRAAIGLRAATKGAKCRSTSQPRPPRPRGQAVLPHEAGARVGETQEPFDEQGQRDGTLPFVGGGEEPALAGHRSVGPRLLGDGPCLLGDLAAGPRDLDGHLAAIALFRNSLNEPSGPTRISIPSTLTVEPGAARPRRATTLPSPRGARSDSRGGRRRRCR